MMKQSSDRITAVDIAMLILAFFIVAGSLGYVFLHKQLSASSEISLEFFDSESEYDTSVINKASKEDFMQIGGIGEVKAHAIISYRDSLGGFDDVYQLLDLSVVTPQVFEDIIAYFYLDGCSASAQSDKLSEEVNSLITDPLESESEATLEDTDSVSRRSVNVNTASAFEIAECLQISNAASEQVVRVREIIGGYNDILELSLCDLITEEIISQIKDYVLF